MIRFSTAPKGEISPDLGIDLGTFRCGQFRLSRREHQILDLLNRRFGLMVGWERLIDTLYAEDDDGGPDNPRNVLSVTVCALRRKMLDTGYQIVTVHSEGFILKYRPYTGMRQRTGT